MSSRPAYPARDGAQRNRAPTSATAQDWQNDAPAHSTTVVPFGRRRRDQLQYQQDRPGALSGTLLSYRACGCGGADRRQDEVFHIPQAQAYCRDAFDVWDPKLTTPAGLYLLSYPLSFFNACTPALLRAVNAFGVVVPLPMLVYRIQQTIHGRAPAAASDNAQTALNVALFPLLYFFGGLYYTDVWSTVFVLAAYLATLQRRPWTAAVFAWVGLWFRQTNVVWAVFMAAVCVVRRLQEEDAAVFNPPVSPQLLLRGE